MKKYIFDLMGAHVECDLTNDNTLFELRKTFGDALDDILKNKEQYRVITDAERVVILEAENKELRDATVDLGNIIQEQQDALLDLANMIAGGDK